MTRIHERAPAGLLGSGVIRHHVLLGAAITALGGLLFGYDTGVISGALLFIGSDFRGLTSFDKELLTSILLIGALIGALAAGRIADRAGRRPTVLGTAALFVAGVMLAAFSPSYGVLVAARVIIGLAVGSASMVVSLYIGEVVPPRIRGDEEPTACRTSNATSTPWAGGDRMRPRLAVAVAAVLAAVSLAASGCTSASPGPPVSLPVPKTGEITFYLSLPASTTGLSQAAAQAAAPGSPHYRHFSSLTAAAGQFGATDARISTIAASVGTLGLRFAADPTRLFGRVTGSAKQWQAALGTPLTVQAATASDPFITCSLPSRTPAALEPSGTRLLLRQAEVYDPAAEGRRPPGGPGPASAAADRAALAKAAEPWPRNTGTPVTAGCSAPPLQQGEVYTEQQVQTAYGVTTLRARASGTPVITILDLGGGWLASDLKLAGDCFGYSPPRVDQMQGDGVVSAIRNADPETSLDLQTAAAVAPGAQFRLVQSTAAAGGILDGFSRALGGPGGLPDVISLSYGGCAIAENTAMPAFTSVVDAVLAMAALTGVSSFVAAGDAGATTCGTSVSGTTLSYPAVSPFVTAVGGTRLTLGKGNTRVSETVWNDSVYGQNAAGGGGLSRREPRPAYQNGFNPQNHRGVPDVSALADIVPGWPDVVDAGLQAVGGTSGSTPFTAAATALVDGSQRKAGRPRVGLANGWFYQAASPPGAFYDITTGTNDLAGVGCCQAKVGYDLASGLGVPNWAVLPGTLPPPG